MKRIMISIVTILFFALGSLASGDCEEIYGGTWHICDSSDIIEIHELIENSGCTGNYTLYFTYVPC